LSAVTTPLCGHLSDRIGRKRMYLIGAVTMGGSALSTSRC
jgi:MFS family permease